jgi:small-conductance mechanosensitive channel
VDWWKRATAVGVVIVLTLVIAKLADRAIARRLELPPEALTRYRVLRRTVVAAIVAVGVLSALLVIPEVRAVAGGVLASSAVVGLVIGMAARTTLANFVAGLLIAFTQPLRLGDEVRVDEASGTVEEIALTYTVIREAGGARYYVPNEKLASDTIRNATIAGAEQLAQVRFPVPLSADLDRVVTTLEEEAKAAAEAMPGREPVARVTEVEDASAVVTVDAWTATARVADVASEIRLRTLRRLRSEGLV